MYIFTYSPEHSLVANPCGFGHGMWSQKNLFHPQAIKIVCDEYRYRFCCGCHELRSLPELHPWEFWKVIGFQFGVHKLPCNPLTLWRSFTSRVLFVVLDQANDLDTSAPNGWFVFGKGISRYYILKMEISVQVSNPLERRNSKRWTLKTYSEGQTVLTCVPAWHVMDVGNILSTTTTTRLDRAYNNANTRK